MAKKGGKSKGEVSAGIHSNVKKSTLRDMRAQRTVIQKWLDLKAAWQKGKNPWLTIENPDKSETNKKFIRVRANEHWGSYKAKNQVKSA